MSEHVKIIKQIDSMFGHVGEVVRREGNNVVVKIKHGFDGVVSEFSFHKDETEPTSTPPGGISAKGTPVSTSPKRDTTFAPSSPAPQNFTRDNKPIPTAESPNPGHTTEDSTVNLTADAKPIEPKKADEVKGRLGPGANKDTKSDSEPKASGHPQAANESSKKS